MKNLLKKVIGGVKRMANKTFDNVNGIVLDEVAKYQYSTIFFLLGLGLITMGGGGMLLYKDSYKMSKNLAA